MVYINRDIRASLIERFRLAGDRLINEAMTLRQDVQPIVDVSEVYKENAFAQGSKGSQGAETYLAYITVPLMERWVIYLIHVLASVADCVIAISDGSVVQWLESSTGAATARIKNISIQLEAGQSIGLYTAAGINAQTVTVTYLREYVNP